MAHYVCSGSKMKCTLGSDESELDLRRSAGFARVYGEPMATITDNLPMINIMPFGQCKSLANPSVAAATAANYGRLQEMPCVPNTVSPWLCGKPDVFIEETPALLDNGILMCAWMGKIEITGIAKDTVKEGCVNPERNGVVVGCEETDGEETKEEEIAEDENGGGAARNGRVGSLTVKVFAEILKAIEKNQSYEAARHYANNNIDYYKINKLAIKFVSAGDNKTREREKDNDPNLMPTRFMILYGADDDGLRRGGNVDRHPDVSAGAQDHEVCVANLRSALILLGYEIEESGAFDDPLYHALLAHLDRYRRVDFDRVSEDAEDHGVSVGAMVQKYGISSWKYFCKESDGNAERVADHDRIIEDLGSGYGDKLVKEKGADPKNYAPGVCYRYPWVPFRMTADLGRGYEDGRDARYEIVDAKTLVLLASGVVRDKCSVETLLPDAADILIFVDGREMN